MIFRYMPVESQDKVEEAAKAEEAHAQEMSISRWQGRVLVAGVVLLVLALGALLFVPRGSTPQDKVLNTASGISIWENKVAKSNIPAQNRYAVAYVWSDPELFYTKQNWTINPETFVGPYANGMGACALAMSALASRKLLQESLGPEGFGDAVVLTDNIAKDHAAFFQELGIRVIFSNLTELYRWSKYDSNATYHSHHRAAFFKMRATTLKAGLAGLTDYRSIIYMDVDAYLFDSLPNPDPLALLGKGNFEFATKRCCADAPLSVGIFVMRPNQEGFEDLMRLLKTGFSAESGWGDQGLRIGPHGWPEIICKNHSRIPNLWDHAGSYCANNHTPRWDFIGAEGDKGLLFSEYAVIRTTFKSVEQSDFKGMLPAYNFFGKYKPWMPDTPCVDYTEADDLEFDFHPLSHIPEYWNLYQKYSRPFMINDSIKSPFKSFCVAALDKGLKAYNRCTSTHEETA